MLLAAEPRSSTRSPRLPAVKLEERTIESLPDSCQSCGTTLTDAEKQTALDTGASPVLCATCASEQAPAADDADADAEAGL
jgi:hypothetical protein